FGNWRLARARPAGAARGEPARCRVPQRTCVRGSRWSFRGRTRSSLGLSRCTDRHPPVRLRRADHGRVRRLAGHRSGHPVPPTVDHTPSVETALITFASWKPGRGALRVILGPALCKGCRLPVWYGRSMTHVLGKSVIGEV